MVISPGEKTMLLLICEIIFNGSLLVWVFRKQSLRQGLGIGGLFGRWCQEVGVRDQGREMREGKTQWSAFMSSYRWGQVRTLRGAWHVSTDPCTIG